MIPEKTQVEKEIKYWDRWVTGKRENEGHKKMFRILFKEVIIIYFSYGSLKPIVN